MSARGLKLPFQPSDRGVAATSGRAALVREQLEQLLFTRPGERVNRPEFGCGVQRLVFASADAATAAAAEYTIATAIRRHLRDLVTLDAVRVSAQEAEIHIDILYTLAATGEALAASFTQPSESSP